MCDSNQLAKDVTPPAVVGAAAALRPQKKQATAMTASNTSATPPQIPTDALLLIVNSLEVEHERWRLMAKFALAGAFGNATASKPILEPFWLEETRKLVGNDDFMRGPFKYNQQLRQAALIGRRQDDLRRGLERCGHSHLKFKYATPKQIMETNAITQTVPPILVANRREDLNQEWRVLHNRREAARRAAEEARRAAAVARKEAEKQARRKKLAATLAAKGLGLDSSSEIFQEHINAYIDNGEDTYTVSQLVDLAAEMDFYCNQTEYLDLLNEEYKKARELHWDEYFEYKKKRMVMEINDDESTEEDPWGYWNHDSDSEYSYSEERNSDEDSDARYESELEEEINDMYISYMRGQLSDAEELGYWDRDELSENAKRKAWKKLLKEEDEKEILRMPHLPPTLRAELMKKRRKKKNKKKKGGVK